MSTVEKELKKRKLAILEEKIRLAKGLPHLYGYKNYPWMTEYLNTNNRDTYITAANQIGKLLDDDEIIPTPKGFVRNGDLKVGDYVFGDDGNQTKVIKVIHEDSYQCYEITFDDGSKVIAGKDHLWSCKTSKERFRKTYKYGRGKKIGNVFKNESFNTFKVLTTEQIIKSGGYLDGNVSAYNKVSIPITKAVNYTEKDLFDPYLVGLLLGDGGLSSRTVILTSGDSEIKDYVINHYNAKPIGKFGYRLNGLQEKMRELGLFGTTSETKFIPNQYKFGSIDQRKQLIAGLLDTDGTINKNGNRIEYYTISKQLAYDFVEVINSLGGLAEITIKKAFYKKNGVKVDCSDCYRISVKVLFNPFKLKRKRDRFKLNTRYRHERIIYSIKDVGMKSATCISVDNDSHLYLCTKGYIVTHNSTIQIRKCVDMATDIKKWPTLWRKEPRQFWYLYPNRDTATAEFHTKWVPDILPKNEYKQHEQYGWKEEMARGQIQSIVFNTGIRLYFKTYSQDVQDLQTGTCDAIFCDEELVVDLYDELNFRRSATDGYFSMVFTATIGQELWRLTMEPKAGEKEMFPYAWKKQVSLFDCQRFEDGTESHWTTEKINRVIASCKSEAEVQRRVYGRFVVDSGLKYPQFRRHINVVKPYKIQFDWHRYVGVDIGAGGADNHPSTISFVAVSPDFKKAAVYKHWRGDKQVTTVEDVVDKVVSMANGEILSGVFYDYSSKDFETIATRKSLPVTKADKTHTVGESILNVLFKNEMLDIFDYDEMSPLINEIVSLKSATDKRKAIDDSVDSLRYACSKIPWNWESIGLLSPNVHGVIKEISDKQVKDELTEEREKFRLSIINGKESDPEEFNQEMEAWNELYDI